jgi:NAD(P)-dependent dehydrogenase (short-subunit alcohol dehydrogenase family)
MAEDDRSYSLPGKAVLITGAARNLGAVVAAEFASQGSKVALVDRQFSPEAVLRLERINRQPSQAAHFVADVTDPLQIRNAVDQAQAAFGPIDILINNAGPFSMDPYLNMRVEVWDEIMNANLRAVYLFSQLVAPGMNERGWGRIINMAAGSAFLRNHSVYSLAKSSIIFLTEQLALELKPGVTVNAIAPGQIAESAPDISALDPTFVERAIAVTPARRLVSRVDIARLMVRLCSAEFDMLTGHTIPMDGGARLPRF